VSRAVLRIVVTATLAAVVGWGVVSGALEHGEGDRYRELTTTLRCPVCQGESVADSPSENAQEMGTLIRQQIEAGWTDPQIRQFFIDRYGRWILLDPPRRGTTLVVWTVPLLAVTGGVIAVASRLERTPRRARLMAGAGILGLASVVAVVVAGARQPVPRDPEPLAAPSGAATDLQGVTNQSMEEVVAANPEVIGMRLALLERYLDEGNLDAAYRHSSVAINLPATDQEYQRALRLHGWVTALKGAPASGAEYLQAALALSPTDRDALWFLANVQHSGLNDHAAAQRTLEQLLTTVMTDAERARVQSLLAEVEQAE
jgi:cytochrome c-type biogenesis protein CcmH/NrfF